MPWQFKTIVGLVVSGLVVVTLPLAIGIGISMAELARVTRSSHDLVFENIAAMRTLNELERDVVSLHRLALQFQEINDPQTIALATERLAGIESSLGSLAAFDPENVTADLRKELLGEAQAAYAPMSGRAPIPTESDSPQDRGVRLQSLAGNLSTVVNRMSRAQVQSLEADGQRQRRYFLFFCLVLVPLTVGMVVYFSKRITRPIHGLVASIGRMQQGDLATGIHLKGTPELEQVASHLDELRGRLSRLQEERKSFFREVSHELKTPLATLKLGVDLLAGEKYGALTGPQHEVVDAMVENCDALHGQIENVLDFNGWAERHSDMSITRIEVDALLDSLERRHALPMRRRSITVSREGDALLLMADRAKLLVCLGNLFGNAIKYAPADSVVQLRAWQAGDWLGLDVSDCGQGVSPADQPRLFDPFYQGERSLSTHEAGTGLGLCVARECARAHGGDVTLLHEQAPPVGPPRDPRYTGACFRLTLPARTIATDEAAA